eukprot:TRINITY_DN3653_c0_g1_i1.p1 TRINITY_DN3653_c0_g1~~TRINITY_DN3653_c0_g1_i1.p1  ORF type:complete len:151 (+),score=38.07 TRINITY_DN3653_c0_g1_i1:479-931(+)
MSEGAQKIYDTPNAGGKSVWSEAMSFEIIGLLFNAKLSKTEMELEYWPMGSKITDYSVDIQGQKFGVSVTRAMKFKGIFTEEDATDLLKKKLYGITVSSKNVIGEVWTKQILHVWTEKKYMCDVLMSAFEKMDTELKSNPCCEKADWIFY